MVDNDDTDETLYDQSEEQTEDVNIKQQIVLSRPSLPINICDDDESPKFLPVSPNISTRSIYHTSPTYVNTSELSPSFDITADEMMLFEMYGEVYDKIVDDMYMQQKFNRGEKEISKVAEKLHKLMHEKSREFSIGSTVSFFSLAASTPTFLPTSLLNLLQNTRPGPPNLFTLMAGISLEGPSSGFPPVPNCSRSLPCTDYLLSPHHFFPQDLNLSDLLSPESPNHYILFSHHRESSRL